MASKEILEAIWREFWEEPGVPVFPGDFESFVRCKETFCRVAVARLPIVENVMDCTLCGGPVDRFPGAYQCRECGALGCLETGVMFPAVDYKPEEGSDGAPVAVGCNAELLAALKDVLGDYEDVARAIGRQPEEFDEIVAARRVISRVEGVPLMIVADYKPRGEGSDEQSSDLSGG